MEPQHWLILVNLFLIFALKLACFTFGYLTVKIGASLLREGVKGEFVFDASLTGPKAMLRSASPGLLFLALGIALIAYAMHVTKIIETIDDRPAHRPAPTVPIPPAAAVGAVQEAS